jgi:O-antigen/teichoic acid export membrane protein
LSFIFVPIYLKYLGAEAYGLIGFYVFLQSVFMLADMGLSGAFSRETARLSAIKGMQQNLRDLCRTFEVLFTAIGLFISLTIVALSRFIAEHWVNPNSLSIDTVSTTLIMIGITAGIQFPFFIYQGGFIGLQKQAYLNIVLVGIGLLRGIGAILVLALIAPSIQAYFFWQILVSIIQLLISHFVIWRIVAPVNNSAIFNIKLIPPLWRFAAGMAGITFSGILLTQVDKLILSKILTLESFGYYSLSTVVASIPGIISFPIFNAVYPRFTQLVTTKNITELQDLYHRSSQLLTVLLIPIGFLLSFFSKEIMFIWTGNAITAENTHLMVTILVAGSTLMGLMMIPYALQLSYAWTGLALRFNFVALLALVPSLFWLVKKFGALGACYILVILYFGQFIIIIHFMHRRVLITEKYKWYINDIGKPLLLPLILMIIGREIFTNSKDTFFLIINLSAIFFLSVLFSAICASHIRNELLSWSKPFISKIILIKS